MAVRYDGSENEQKEAPFARDLARTHYATATLRHALHPPKDAIEGWVAGRKDHFCLEIRCDTSRFAPVEGWLGVAGLLSRIVSMVLTVLYFAEVCSHGFYLRMLAILQKNPLMAKHCLRERASFYFLINEQMSPEKHRHNETFHFSDSAFISQILMTIQGRIPIFCAVPFWNGESPVIFYGDHVSSPCVFPTRRVQRFLSVVWYIIAGDD